MILQILRYDQSLLYEKVGRVLNERSEKFEMNSQISQAIESGIVAARGAAFLFGSISLISVACCAVAGVSLYPSIVMSLIIFIAPIFGVWLYTRTRTSYKALFRMYRCTTAVLPLTFGWVMWNVTLLMHSHQFYVAHIGLLCVIYLIVFLSALANEVRALNHFSILESYQMQKAIPSEVVLNLITSRQPSPNAMKVSFIVVVLLPAISGLVSVFFGEGFLGLLMFGALVLLLSPYSAAMILASTIQQLRYLGTKDLVIAD